MGRPLRKRSGGGAFGSAWQSKKIVRPKLPTPIDSAPSPVVIITPADPEKVAAYHKTAEYKHWEKLRMKKRSFND